MAPVLHKYAIRRKSDGFYMPLALGRNGRGGSMMEPVDPNLPGSDIRLFFNKKGAETALRAWLKGEWVTTRGEHMPYDSFSPEYYEETNIVPKPDRKADDMEVVEIQLILPE